MVLSDSDASGTSPLESTRAHIQNTDSLIPAMAESPGSVLQATRGELAHLLVPPARCGADGELLIEEGQLV